MRFTLKDLFYVTTITACWLPNMLTLFKTNRTFGFWIIGVCLFLIWLWNEPSIKKAKLALALIWVLCVCQLVIEFGFLRQGKISPFWLL